jgi:hypothetical protein
MIVKGRSYSGFSKAKHRSDAIKDADILTNENLKPPMLMSRPGADMQRASPLRVMLFGFKVFG